MKKKIILLSVILLLLFLLCYPAEALCCGKKRTETVVGDLTAYPSSVYDPYRNSGAHRLDYKNFTTNCSFFQGRFWAFSGRSLCISSGTARWLPYGGKVNRRSVLCWKNQPAGGGISADFLQ